MDTKIMDTIFPRKKRRVNSKQKGRETEHLFVTDENDFVSTDIDGGIDICHPFNATKFLN